jgi:signal transduction histidine kinase
LEYVDGNGKQVVKLLLDMAASGGGYVEYKWPDPVTRKQAKKLTYVKAIPNTRWILGSGLYL